MQHLKSIKHLILPIFLTLIALLNTSTTSVAGVYFQEVKSISAAAEYTKKPIQTKKEHRLKPQKEHKFSFFKKDNPSRFGIIALLNMLGFLVFLIIASSFGSLIFSVLAGLCILGAFTFSLWGTRVDKKPRLAKILLIINLVNLLLLMAGSTISVLLS